MFIDSHVHFRDEEQAHKETIAHALGVARDAGVDAVFDMPNTQRPVLTRGRVEDRLKLAERADVPEVFYGTFLGLTSDKEQIKQAVGAYRALFPRVVGFKLYAGHSVGNLGVVSVEEQAVVYETLTSEGYEGVLFVHAEKEREMNAALFKPENPISHCLARPAKAEYESVRDQIALAQKYKFRGKLHIAHISHASALYLVEKARRAGLDVSCGACPHHLFYDSLRMKGSNGILFKMNPPLRLESNRHALLAALKGREVNWIETDHAPHTLGEKTSGSYMSGIPGLPWWPLFEELLREHDFTDAQIQAVTFDNVAKRFGVDIKRTRKPIRDRRADYPFNPYSGLEAEIGFNF